MSYGVWANNVAIAPFCRVSFDSYRNEAMIVSTLDLHQLPGTIVLLRGEVNASVLREHIPCADLGR